MPSYLKGFIPYGLAAFLIGIVGGFSTVLGPAFVSDLGLDYNNTTWTALATAMSAAACAPILGKLGDVLGRRLTLLAGIAVYTLGNVLSAISLSLPFMLIARFVTGLGTAAISPVILSYIMTDFPKDKLSKGFSLYMLISSGAVIFGPALGGIITDRLGWRTMMWLCSGISALVWVLCFGIKSEKNIIFPFPKNFDYAGSVLTILFFSLALCIPSFGQNFGISSKGFIAAFLLALMALAGLVLAEKRAVSPILPLKVITRGNFILPVVILFLTQGLMQANITNMLVFARYTMPDNSVLSAYAVSVMYIGMAAGSVILGPLGDRHSPKPILTLSLSLCAVSCLALFFLTKSPAFPIMAFGLGTLGLGLGGSSTILMKTALSGLAPEESGAASGTYNLFRDLSAPFGVAVLVPFFTNRTASLILSGLTERSAALSSMGSLALIEIVCVICAIIIVRFLPNRKGENK